MNDLPPESRPMPPPDPDAAPTQAIPASSASPGPALGPPVGPAAPAKQPLRDRLWSLRAVIAVALASVIIGGLGGAALASVSNHDDASRGPGQGRFGRGGPGGPGGFGGPPGMMNPGGPGQNGTHQWPGRRGMGQRQGEQQQPPGGGLTPLPKPTLPTPTG